ncbi:terminase small subunit [Niameybacter massiliensis]|uniref:terminase small subunit n=1 Tax=Niameybacter massiliensis TaxID=1658108 RepID=UPI0009E38B3C|nr:terminase small subunit [Niameybacter massiliensis]
MTNKQKAFVDEYLIDLNATRAYKAVYRNVKSDDAARASSSKLLTNANIKEYLDKRMRDREKRTEITQDKVLAELAQIAFANGADFAKVVEKPLTREDGSNILDPETEQPIYYKTVEMELTDKLPEDKKKAISGIKMGKNGIEVATCDKVRALELLGRHLGIFKDKVEVNGNINNPYEGLTKAQLIALAGDDDG